MKKLIRCILVLAAVFTLQACKTDKGGEKPAAVPENTDRHAASTAAIDMNKPILRFGYMICDSHKLSEERFAPFTAYLEKKLGRRVEMILKNTFEFESRKVEPILLYRRITTDKPSRIRTAKTRSSIMARVLRYTG